MSDWGFTSSWIAVTESWPRRRAVIGLPIAPVGIGEVMRAGGIGTVIASKNPAYAIGDRVSASLGVQEYGLIPEARMKASGIFKIDLRAGSITQWLNVLGLPGMTGNFGLMDVGQPKAG